MPSILEDCGNLQVTLPGDSRGTAELVGADTQMLTQQMTRRGNCFTRAKLPMTRDDIDVNIGGHQLGGWRAIECKKSSPDSSSS